MGCDQIKERLSEYLDGCLDHESDRRVKDHLDSCPKCSRELEELEGIVKTLGALPVMEAPSHFLSAVRRRIEQSEVSFWQKAAVRVNAALDLVPLKAMTGLAAAALVVIVFLASTDRMPGAGSDYTAAGRPEDTMTGILESSTQPVRVELASTNPTYAAPEVYVETPTEFIMRVVENDAHLKKYQVLPHPKGVGVLIHTPRHLYEVVVDPAEFPVIQAHIEQMGGGIPGTLREARALYPIYVRTLPSPTRPLSETE